MLKANKIRLDLLVQKKLVGLSRTQAINLVLDGKVKVDGKVMLRPGVQVGNDTLLEIDFVEPKYVGRAGFKLEKALEQFKINVKNLVVLDSGLSTGGFTDCLLQNGAAKVYGIDVGRDQVHSKIGNDDRVVVMEQTNLRNLQELPEQVDLVTLDLSFISILKVVDVVARFLKPGGKLIVLVKPQFEAERNQIGRGGIIKDEKIHKEVIAKVMTGIKNSGFEFIDIIDSPIMGGDGNKEFLAYFVKK